MKEEIIVQIERLAVERLDEERKRLGLSQEALGTRAYPDAKNPYMKVQALRIKRGHGEPQRLRLGDFVALCEAMNLDPGKVLWEVCDLRLKV
ncbi:hypothetical protein [uncultured Desulfovibrio sp.]|uniref:hypothetical protein n=1 Tax=uncultured Desulfovibrio sp. TaxID=167968 RepID=UPI00039F19AB|nr:hypothetical protein [uncultured Desulfovibrio sp.]